MLIFILLSVFKIFWVLCKHFITTVPIGRTYYGPVTEEEGEVQRD